MRYIEILKEYSSAKTASNYGQKLLQVMLRDSTLPEQVKQYVDAVKSQPDDASLQQKAISAMLTVFETLDPTTHKEYVQWLVKAYATAHDSFSTIAKTAKEYLNIYNIGKKRGKLPAEHADINKFKNYDDFEFMMMCADHDSMVNKKEVNKGKAKTVYDTATVRVVALYDEAASVYYGQGTAWCTAYTDRETHFAHHNSKGQLYVILPKKPEYNGEKYQISIDQVMAADDTNDDVRFDWLLKYRLPELYDFFKKLYPNSQLWGYSIWDSEPNPDLKYEN